MDMKIDGPKTAEGSAEFKLGPTASDGSMGMTTKPKEAAADFNINSGNGTDRADKSIEVTSKVTPKSMWLAGIAAAALAAAVWLPFAGNRDDVLTDKDNQIRAETMQSIIAAGGIAPETMSKADALIAVSDLKPASTQYAASHPQLNTTIGQPATQQMLTTVTPAQTHEFAGYADPKVKENLAQQIESGQVRIVTFSLFDDLVEDGDVVQVSGYGFSYIVPLYNNPTWVQVPVPMHGPGSVTITGIRDGGGGITLGVGVPGATLPIPALYPGKSLTLPIQ
ncbi:MULTISPECIES: hypothetical protein [unclassified Pannonibacter]|uniref:hypothetical protein n=1 Tax=unclassified Pannonibacter TaxID=2627228 RepID=UPI0016485E60|nr:MULTISPECIES: hypothetical protein [unclassified Pannonibacter]